MIVYDVATKVLNTESFPQHSTAGLISGITFIVLFSQEKPLRWKKILKLRENCKKEVTL